MKVLEVMKTLGHKTSFQLGIKQLLKLMDVWDTEACGWWRSYIECL